MLNIDTLETSTAKVTSGSQPTDPKTHETEAGEGAVADGVQLLTPLRAAAHLGLTVAELSRLRRGDDGPDWGKLVRGVRYDLEDLNCWLRTTCRSID